MPGGQTPIDVNSDTANQAAMCAVMDLNAKSNSLYQMQLMRIVSGTSQVVSGVKYTMVIEVGTSAACRNNGNTPSLATCPVDPNSPLAQYEVVVWLQPWLTPACTVLSSARLAAATTSAPATAQPTTKASLLGGPASVNPTDLAVMDAATCAVAFLNKQSNSAYQLELVDVVSGTQQVVAGMKYSLVFNAGLSTACLNDGSTPNSACPVAQETVAPYKAVVLIQSWMTPSCTVQSAEALDTGNNNNNWDSSSGPSGSSNASGGNIVLWLGVGVAAVLAVAAMAFLAVRANRNQRLGRNPSTDTISSRDELVDPLLEDDY